MASKNPYYRVEVKWVDTVSCTHWTPLDQQSDLRVAHCSSLGYLRGFDEDAIRLSHTINEDSGDFTVIPTGCIQSVTLLVSKGKSLSVPDFFSWCAAKKIKKGVDE